MALAHEYRLRTVEYQRALESYTSVSEKKRPKCSDYPFIKTTNGVGHWRRFFGTSANRKKLIAQYTNDRGPKLIEKRKAVVSAKNRLITAAKRIYTRCFEDAYKRNKSIVVRRYFPNGHRLIIPAPARARLDKYPAFHQYKGTSTLRVGKLHGRIYFPDIIGGNLFDYGTSTVRQISAGGYSFISNDRMNYFCNELDLSGHTREEPLPPLPLDPISFIREGPRIRDSEYGLARGIFDWYGGVRTLTLTVLIAKVQLDDVENFWKDLPTDVKKIIVELVRDT